MTSSAGADASSSAAASSASAAASAAVIDDWETVEEQLLHVEHGGLLAPLGAGAAASERARCRLAGLDTASPRVQLGRLNFIGQYQYAPGTVMYFELLGAGGGGGDDGPTCRLVGQTEKLLKLEPHFAPTEAAGTSKDKGAST